MEQSPELKEKKLSEEPQMKEPETRSRTVQIRILRVLAGNTPSSATKRGLPVRMKYMLFNHLKYEFGVTDI